MGASAFKDVSQVGERVDASIVRSWQTRLRKLFKLANVSNSHAHRFRDTFTVELLLAGVPIERVSILLGHQSVRITEKHYARGCARDRNNWKRIWLTPGVAIRSFFCKVGYTRGTRKEAAQQLIHLQQEKLVPGVGVGLRCVLQTNNLFVFSGNRTSKIHTISQCGHA